MSSNNKSLIKTINKLNLTDDEREKFNKINEDNKGNFFYNRKSKPILAVGAFFAIENCEVTEL